MSSEEAGIAGQAGAARGLRVENLKGAVFMLIAMGAFTTGDAVMKWIAEAMPLYQAVVLRGIIMLPMLFMVARLTGGLHLERVAASWRPLASRTIGEVMASLCFFVALVNLPLATVTSINQAVPLGVTAGAALFLGEKVGWRRMVAVLAGFFGVLLIVRPGAEGINGYAVFSLASVCFVVLRDLSTRRLRPDVPSVTVALAASLAITLVSLVISLREPWVMVPPGIWPLLVVAAGLVLIGYIFVVRVMRVGEVAVTMPFRYSALLWAIGLSWLMWGHVPDLVSLLGVVIVVASGLFTLWRERRVAR